MSDLIRISEGHYEDQNKNVYKSIWKYKIDDGFVDYLNIEKINSSEALDLINVCQRKEIKDFNFSAKYNEGYVYLLSDLEKYYQNKPRRLKIKISGKKGV